MKIGDSVKKSIDDWEAGEMESSVLHACNAIDGTARKMFPSLGSKARFIKLLRENYSVLGSMGMPGINLETSLFPLNVNGKYDGENVDIATIIYVVHRCTHGHGDELPAGFEFKNDAAGQPEFTRFTINMTGTIELSDRMIFGMLAVAIIQEINSEEKIPDGYYLTFGSSGLLYINDWWGKYIEFASLTEKTKLPLVTMVF